MGITAPDTPARLSRGRDAGSRNAGSRAFWLRQFRLWHWVSAALGLAGMLLFAVTGLTLNHAGLFAGAPVITEQAADLPPALLELLEALPEDGDGPLPAGVEGPLAAWAAAELKVNLAGRSAEISEDEIYFAMPRPGVDAWLSIDRQGGEVMHRQSDRGWVAVLNDLHKGRDAGPAWSLVIDFLAVVITVFSLTGLGLLWFHAGARPSTWPLGWAGVLLPLLVALLMIH